MRVVLIRADTSSKFCKGIAKQIEGKPMEGHDCWGMLHDLAWRVMDLEAVTCLQRKGLARESSGRPVRFETAARKCFNIQAKNNASRGIDLVHISGGVWRFCPAQCNMQKC